MKILHLPNYYYPNVGGIEVTARDFVRALLEAGYTDQQVLCMNKGRKETVTETIDGIPVTKCGSPVQIFSQSLSLGYPGRLGGIFRRQKPDAVVLHWPNPFTGRCLMQHAKEDFRFILYWHSDIIKQKIGGKLFEKLADDLAARADVIVATSPNYIDGSRILSRYREKCVVVPSCIEPKRLEITGAIQKRIEEIRSEHAGKTFCFAFGRHVPYKGFEYLEEAKKYLPENIDVVVGEKLPQEELIAYLAACDIFCFPSITKNEAFGLGLAEGMYFGHPAVTFTIPGSGVNYVSLNGVTGIECPNRDAKAYAEALIRLSEDRPLREKLGKAAKERVENNFVYEQYKKNIIRGCQF